MICPSYFRPSLTPNRRLTDLKMHNLPPAFFPFWVFMGFWCLPWSYFQTQVLCFFDRFRSNSSWKTSNLTCILKSTTRSSQRNTTIWSDDDNVIVTSPVIFRPSLLGFALFRQWQCGTVSLFFMGINVVGQIFRGMWLLFFCPTFSMTMAISLP